MKQRWTAINAVSSSGMWQVVGQDPRKLAQILFGGDQILCGRSVDDLAQICTEPERGPALRADEQRHRNPKKIPRNQRMRPRAAF